ncbi:8-oxo-dGTP diphosphatase MutT [Gloeocapsa sp. PCC 73106]|uniref:8-oxo-dGTP diphosphatase MutT n=1 Tax=Gloeocapsa sp. PCC 73106 TaxID=102232 RepID=UPI001EE65977|nr:8-oxo-dGTP diphosphatase MutT [Gloeocapsa sp. PCC 73106]
MNSLYWEAIAFTQIRNRLMTSGVIPHKRIGVGVIANNQGQILIDRRLPSGLMAGLWEFPGGKIEVNESVETCIVRELKEELGIDVIVGEHLITIEHDYQEFKITLIVHHCRISRGEPQPLECAEIRWVSLKEIEEFTFPEANYQIIAALR